MNIAFDDDRQVRGLLHAMRQAGSRGDAREVDRLFRQAEEIAPGHPLVASEAAARALRVGNAPAAMVALERLAAEAPSYPEIWFNLALVRRAQNRWPEAIAAFDRVIAIDPHNLGALLEKAQLQEQLGRTRAAAVTYFAALQSVPPRGDLPPPMREKLKRAQDAVDANHRALESFIDGELTELRARHGGASLKRFDRCVDMLLRKREVYRQEPTFMFFPELPAIEFYDRELFPWLADLEAATGDIRAELLDVLAERGTEAIDPYVAGPAGSASTREGLGRWRSYPFWREGVPYPDHQARCPRTMKVLEACPQWDAPGTGPNTMFSLLEAKTRIPPHTGTANTRLVAHLALIVPQSCGFRVGSEQREWREGEAFVFDDTIVHEAWNESDQLRAILIVDVWSPYLSDAERDLVRALSARVGQYYGTLPQEPAAVPA